MLLSGVLWLAPYRANSQTPADSVSPPSQTPSQTTDKSLQTRPAQPLPLTPVPTSSGHGPVIINGRPYQRPTQHQLFTDYVSDSYGLPAFARSTVRTLYNQAQGSPSGWGQDGPGFAQRFGSNLGITAISGNVRYGMEEVFHEDLRYIPCHGCSAKHKIENALLAEFTARHDSDGHRFFTLTPIIADYAGPLIAHYAWYPPSATSPFYSGLVGTRTVFATRIGGHLFREFILERRHKDPPMPR
jgi:hypothetical protein